MRRLSHDTWRALMSAEGGVRLSIHMPTQVAGPETQQNPILFKNLLSQAQSQLSAVGLEDARIDSYLAEARGLLENTDFWQRQNTGLAVFTDNEATHVYQGSFATRPLVIAAPRFHLLPLIDIFEHDTVYYILALSASQAKLFQASADHIEPLEMQGVPASLREAMGYDEPQRQLQFHTGAAPQAEPISGARPAVFHGHGVGTDQAQEKQRLHEYCRMLTAGLIKTLAGTHVPLVVAAAEPLLSIFRQLCVYPGLTVQSIEGSPEPIDERWLLKEGNRVVCELNVQQKHEVFQAYEHVADTPRASSRPKEVLTAVHDGRVQTLLVTPDQPLWGRYDKTARDLTTHAVQQADSEDLNNLAAIMTLRSGGDVVVLPEDEPTQGLTMAAVYRYVSA